MQTQNNVFLLFPDFIFPWENTADCRENRSVQLGVNFNTLNQIIFKLNSCTINDRISKLPNYLKYNFNFYDRVICNPPAGLLHLFLALISPRRKVCWFFGFFFWKKMKSYRRMTKWYIQIANTTQILRFVFALKKCYLAFHSAHITPQLSSNLKFLMERCIFITDVGLIKGFKWWRSPLFPVSCSKYVECAPLLQTCVFFLWYGLVSTLWIPQCLWSLDTKGLSSPQSVQILSVRPGSVWHNGLWVLKCYSNTSNKSQEGSKNSTYGIYCCLMCADNTGSFRQPLQLSVAIPCIMFGFP